MTIQIVGDRSCYWPEYKNVIRCGVDIKLGKDRGKDCKLKKGIEIGTFNVKDLNKNCNPCES